MRSQEMVIAWVSVLLGICCLLIAATGLSDTPLLPPAATMWLLTWGPFICMAWVGALALSAGLIGARPLPVRTRSLVWWGVSLLVVITALLMVAAEFAGVGVPAGHSRPG